MLRRKIARRPQVRAAVASLVLVVVALSVTSASAAAPAGPVVVAPANGATNVSRSPSLDVTVADPDGGTMDVTFFGRPATGQLPGDFTLGELPDTQNYSKNENNTFAKYMAQVQWYRDTRSQLNTVFITHLGDVVEHWKDESEFQRASQAQAVLDNAGIPNSITTGNHDIDKNNGDAPLFDQYFPPSRYESNSWYGGYLGDTTDAVAETTNRRNKDSYHLINVGSLKFLFISLEADLPPYALQWAQNVIDAYPDRRVVVTTHGFIRPQGQRHDKSITPQQRDPGTYTTAINAFNQFIYPNCNIFLVLSGHFHSEADRTDTNACGRPVFQILSNYQARANGGDGWLRYLTFRPSQNRIEAYTYSPTLSRFETDKNSRFDLTYNMTNVAPGPFQSLGVAQDVPSGGHAVLAWPGLAANTQYEWYAVASDGGASTQGPTSAFTTGTGGGPNSPPVATNQNVVVQRNISKSITLTATDPDGDPITYSIVSNPSHGTLSGSGANRTYTPANGYQGADSFTFRGSDASSSGNIATVSISVVGGPTTELSITNSGFSKATVSVSPGTFVNWTNTGSAQHRVVDDSGLGLYDSGLLSNGQSWGREFSGPGLWLYRDPTTGATANVRIKPNVSPANGGTSTTFTITWATAAPPAGMVYDVQIKRGAAAWDNWSTDVSTLSRTFVADAGTGSYQFRARTQRTSDGAETGWSGGVTIQVG